jgi:hypothetical protein
MMVVSLESQENPGGRGTGRGNPHHSIWSKGLDKAFCPYLHLRESLGHVYEMSLALRD